MAGIRWWSACTVPEIWHRHFYDSAQLFPYLISDGPVIDMGSGAGFPGLVLAAMGRRNVILIESNGKTVPSRRKAPIVSRCYDCQARIEACGSFQGRNMSCPELWPFGHVAALRPPCLLMMAHVYFLRAGPSKRN